MSIVLLISQKDYVLYEKRTGIVFAGHAVAAFGNGGLRRKFPLNQERKWLKWFLDREICIMKIVETSRDYIFMRDTRSERQATNLYDLAYVNIEFVIL